MKERDYDQETLRARVMATVEDIIRSEKKIEKGPFTLNNKLLQAAPSQSRSGVEPSTPQPPRHGWPGDRKQGDAGPACGWCSWTSCTSGRDTARDSHRRKSLNAKTCQRPRCPRSYYCAFGQPAKMIQLKVCRWKVSSPMLS